MTPKQVFLFCFLSVIVIANGLRPIDFNEFDPHDPVLQRPHGFRNLVSTPTAAKQPINYNGGPVMTGTIRAYNIFFGNKWSQTSVNLLTTFVGNIGASGAFSINHNFFMTPSSPQYASQTVTLSGTAMINASSIYSNGSHIQYIVKSTLQSGQFPVDSNGIYFFISSSEINVTDGFCKDFCGYHSYLTYSGVQIKYVFVGDSSTLCPGGCAAFGTSTNKPPNGDFPADSIANTLFHELSETTTDPLLNAWYDSGGNENGDQCAWKFSPVLALSGNRVYNTMVGGLPFLIQQLPFIAGGAVGTSNIPDTCTILTPTITSVSSTSVSGYNVTISGSVSTYQRGTPTGPVLLTITSSSTSAVVSAVNATLDSSGNFALAVTMPSVKSACSYQVYASFNNGPWPFWDSVSTTSSFTACSSSSRMEVAWRLLLAVLLVSLCVVGKF